MSPNTPLQKEMMDDTGKKPDWGDLDNIDKSLGESISEKGFTKVERKKGQKTQICKPQNKLKDYYLDVGKIHLSPLGRPLAIRTRNQEMTRNIVDGTQSTIP